MKKILSIFLVTVLCSQVCFGSAEHYLRKLATQGKIGRIIGSISVMAGGYHIYNLGNDISEGKSSHRHDTVVQALDGDADALKSAGASLSSLGILGLFLPGPAEKELKNIRKIENPKERESASRSAIVRLAKREKMGRYILGSGLIYTSLYANSGKTRGHYLLAGILFFILESPAEKYLEKLQMKNFLSTENNKIVDPQLYFAFNPYSNLCSVNLQMRF